MSKKAPTSFLLALLALGIIGGNCWERQTSDKTLGSSVDPNGYRRGFFGIAEPITLRTFWEGIDPDPWLKDLGALGVQRLREWTWMSALLLNETTVDSNSRKILDEVILEAKEGNITILGMSHDFPSWITGIEDDPQAVPHRNITAGSDYMRFLDKFRKSWRTLATAFPDITMWEIGNEFNSDLFLKPPPPSLNHGNASSFSAQEKADITTDLLYYGSLGIHEGNPEARTVLGGLAPYPSISGSADFLEMIYGNIESGQWPSIDPDDYFQIACWHPYVFVEPTVSNWVEPNKIVHNVLERHGDGEKAVIFSELGFRDDIVSSEKVSQYLVAFFQLAREHLPWLDTIFWFRLVEPHPATTGEENPLGYGLIHMNGTWKTSGRTYRWLIRVEASLEYLGTLWDGSAFLETLDDRAEDCSLTYNETNYLVHIVLFEIDRMTDKAEAVGERLSGYELDRWKLLSGKEPENAAILEDYRLSSYADQRALWGIYCSYYDRYSIEAAAALNWLKERFDGEKISDPVWLNESYYEPYKLALAAILSHKLGDSEFRDQLIRALLPLQILNPSPARSYNYGGFPGALGKDQDPNDSIPNLETTILVTYALALSSPSPVEKTVDGSLYTGLAVMAALTVAVVTILTKSKPERFNVALS